jgi:hypothetical protein
VGLEDSQGTPLVEHDRDVFLAPIVTAMKTWFSTGTANARHMAANGGGVILGISANAARETYTDMGGFGVATGAVEALHPALGQGKRTIRGACLLRALARVTGFTRRA